MRLSADQNRKKVQKRTKNLEKLLFFSKSAFYCSQKITTHLSHCEFGSKWPEIFQKVHSIFLALWLWRARALCFQVETMRENYWKTVKKALKIAFVALNAKRAGFLSQYLRVEQFKLKRQHFKDRPVTKSRPVKGARRPFSHFKRQKEE